MGFFRRQFTAFEWFGYIILYGISNKFIKNELWSLLAFVSGAIIIVVVNNKIQYWLIETLSKKHFPDLIKKNDEGI